MTQKKASFADLVDYAPVRTLEHEIPAGVVSMDFRVPAGEEGVKLLRDLEGLDELNKAGGDTVGVIAKWAGRLCADAGDLTRERREQVVRTIGARKLVDHLAEVAGLHKETADLGG